MNSSVETISGSTSDSVPRCSAAACTKKLTTSTVQQITHSGEDRSARAKVSARAIADRGW